MNRVYEFLKAAETSRIPDKSQEYNRNFRHK